MKNELRRSSRRIQGLPPLTDVPCPKTPYLPCELKVAVLAQLEKRELKTVRLVSKEWNAVATGPLFDRVYISCRAQDMEVFKNITSHPVISTSVRELVHDVSLFQKNMNFKDYIYRMSLDLKYIKGVLRSDAPLESADVQMNEFFQYCEQGGIDFQRFYKRHKRDTSLVEGYQQYRDHCAYECRYSESGGFFDDICKGLASLKNLRSVVHDHSFWDYALYDNPIFKTPKSNKLHGTSSGSPLSRIWNLFHLRPEGWRKLAYPQYRRSQFTARFQMLTRAICVTGKKISSLQIPESLKRAGLPLQALTTSTLTYSDNRHLITAYSGLKCLDLHIITEEHDPRPALTLLPELLDQTCGLRRLSLHFSTTHPRSLLDKYRYDEIFSAHGSCPELTDLSLSRLAIGGRDLMLFLIRHTRLRQLELDVIDLLDGTWKGVIEGMRRRPELTKLSLGERFRNIESPLFRPDSYGDAVRLFLCRIKSYVAVGGRHPYLPPEEDSDTAMRWYYDMMPEQAYEDM